MPHIYSRIKEEKDNLTLSHLFEFYSDKVIRYNEDTVNASLTLQQFSTTVCDPYII